MSALVPSLQRSLRWHRPLVITTGLMSVLALATLAGVFLDDRVLTGAPIWLKPFKFAVSIAIYTFTLAWLLSLSTRARRWGWWLGTVIAVGVLIEIALIGAQAARGQQSHFNYAAPLDAAIWNTMAGTIVVVWVATMVIAALLLFDRLRDPAVTWAIRFGLILASVGMGLAFLMTSGPTPQQEAAMDAGAPTTLIGAHSVGVVDGGPGLPLTGWSTTGGDLRVPHSIGLHALQALPLFALALGALARRSRRLRDQRVRTGLVGVAAAAYGGLIALTAWQALRGQSLIHPDARTLGVLAAGLVATSIGAAAVLFAGRSVAPQVTPAAPLAR